MNHVHDALTAALRSLVGMPCELLLATNSIRLRFDFRTSPKGRAYIWIDPPWRLTAAGAVITGSNDYPVEDGVEDREAYQSLWKAWCAHFKEVERASLVDVSVGLDYPDLCLHFDSGHRIETFTDDSPGCRWYYKDRVTGEVFEAEASGINHEFDEPAET